MSAGIKVLPRRPILTRRMSSVSVAEGRRARYTGANRCRTGKSCGTDTGSRCGWAVRSRDGGGLRCIQALERLNREFRPVTR